MYAIIIQMHFTLATIDIQSIRDALAACDAAVFSAINIGMGASWLDPVMIAITIIGIGATQAGIGLVTIAAGIAAKKSELRSLGYAILIACIGAFVFSHIAKTYCDRPRPVMLIYDIRLPDCPRFMRSFPSGHTTTAFASALVLAAYMPRLRWVLLAIAGLVGLSRVYLGVHFPYDVIYGAVLGSVIGILSAKLFDLGRNSADKS